jgi:hypothetical protein
MAKKAKGKPGDNGGDENISDEEKAAAKASKGKVAHESDGKGSVFTSKPAVIAYVIFGIPMLVLLAWYAYNVAYFVDEKAMRSMEANIQAQIKSKLDALKKRAKIEGFKLDDYNVCDKVADAYQGLQGDQLEDSEINTLVGIDKKSSKEQREERCVTYAKSVYKMEKTAHHTQHMIVCQGAEFKLGSSGGADYWIRPDPNGRGALQNFNPREKELVRIRKGGTTILHQWHVYNMGDGCIVIGLSKSGIFRMSGSVVRQK